jgi:hypothetical protein
MTLDASHQRVWDLSLLAAAAFVVAMSVMLTPDPIHLSLFGWQLPPLCLFKALTGHDCPGCGLTRSFTYMGHLDPIAAFRMHMLGPVLYLGVAAQIPWRISKLLRGYSAAPVPTGSDAPGPLS